MMRRRSAEDVAGLASGQQNNASKPKRSGSPMGKHNSNSNYGRSKSASNYSPWRKMKGIMKIKSLDESLHSVYGSESSVVEEDGKRKIRIQFTNIEVRSYNRTVGDNPSVSSGPPVTISWEYDPNTTVLAIEEYEKARPVRRTQSQMILPRSVRVDMLRKEWGVSNKEVVRAVRNGVRAKNQRRTTLGNLGRVEKVEEMIEGATKQLLKALYLRKGTSKRASELEKEITRIESQRAQIYLEQTMKGEYDDSETENPWAAELEPDDSEIDASLVRENSPEAPNMRRRGYNQEVHGSSTELPPKPERRTSLEEDVAPVWQEDVAPVWQEPGESASQVRQSPKEAAKRPIIAVEPDDSPSESELEPSGSVAIDC